MGGKLIVGIDPSFTRTGVCVYNGTYSFKSFSSLSKDVYKIDNCLFYSKLLAQDIVSYIKSLGIPYLVAQEYPVMATRVGGILSVLMANLYNLIKETFPDSFYYAIPSMAIKSLTKTNTKNSLLSFVNSNFNIDTKINHDEASALILALIGIRINKCKYKHSFYTL